MLDANWSVALKNMKQEEKSGMMRILSDMIKADGIIDSREITLLNNMKEKYNIKRDDEIHATFVTLSDATQIICSMPRSSKCDFMGDFAKVALSDEFCAREEALLLFALTCLLKEERDYDVDVLSVDLQELKLEDTQILYVESAFDKNINTCIENNYREIISEFKLVGFDFVYIPKISSHYRTISKEQLKTIASFLYPKTSEEHLLSVVDKLHSLSTVEFCKDQLVTKLGLKQLYDVQPSLLLKIGNSLVKDKRYTNFLLVGLTKDVLSQVRVLVDLFSTFYRTYRLNYLHPDKGRFIYSGFYKQIFDILMLKQGVRSTVVIDVLREEIRFPEADIKVDKLSRKAKALYALFLVESPSGGINFTKPNTIKLQERYNKRIKAIQEKYSIIYEMFGGDKDKAPILERSDIRAPMIAHIKKQMSEYKDVLFGIEDYFIQRNSFGNYAVRLSPDLCLCCGCNPTEVEKISESKDWERIIAM